MEKVGVAVLRINGKQYKVSEGSEILVDKLADEKAKPEVLLVSDGSKVKIGKPSLKDVEVKFSVISPLVKGEKVDGFKYKSKSRYRKRYGFRHSYTSIKIDKISF